MKTYTVKLEWNAVSADSPDAAAEEVRSWLVDARLAFDVTDEDTQETVLVDYEDLPDEEEGFARDNLVNGNIKDAMKYLRALKRGHFKTRLVTELTLIQHQVPKHITESMYKRVMEEIL